MLVQSTRLNQRRVILSYEAMSQELKKKLRLIDDNLDDLREFYNVKKIGIFGSFVRNEQSNKSDIDILVEFIEPIGFFKFLELEEKLSKILKRRVDLATKNALKQAVKKEILRDIIYV